MNDIKMKRRTTQLTGIPLHLSELDDGALRDLRSTWRASATNQGRPDRWRQIFYHLVDLIDEEGVRRSLAASEPTPEPEDQDDGDPPTSGLHRFLKPAEGNSSGT